MHIWVTETVIQGQSGGLGLLIIGLQRHARGFHSYAVRRSRVTDRFGGMVCGALVNGEAGLPGAIKSTGENTTDKSLTATPAHGGTGATGLPAARHAVCRPWNKSYCL